MIGWLWKIITCFFICRVLDSHVYIIEYNKETEIETAICIYCKNKQEHKLTKSMMNIVDRIYKEELEKCRSNQ